MATEKSKRNYKYKPKRFLPNHKPGLLTPELEEKLVEFVKLGCSFDLAAKGVGIATQTLSLWRAKAAEKIHNGTYDESDKYCRLYSKLEKAKTERAAKWLGKIEQAMDVQWQAAAWKLERTHPKDFGKEASYVTELKKLFAEFLAEVVNKDKKYSGEIVSEKESLEKYKFACLQDSEEK